MAVPPVRELVVTYGSRSLLTFSRRALRTSAVSSESLLSPFLQQLSYNRNAETVLQNPKLLGEAAYEGLIGSVLGLFGSGTNTAIDLVSNMIYDGIMPSEKLMADAGVSEPEVLGAMAIHEMAKMDEAVDSTINQDAVHEVPLVNIELKYKQGWTDSQKAEADAKVKALTEAKTVKTPVTRRGTSASARYKSIYGESSVPVGYDVDHTIDLQLGGSDDISNLKPLEKSVNRSLGKQVGNAIKHYPYETEFGEFTIH